MDIPEHRLQADLDRLATRLTSEEGIPMFLVCENLVPNETGREPKTVTLTSLNEDLASAFHRDAEAFERIWPRPSVPVPAGMAPSTVEVCKIVEVLAARNFAADRTEGKL